MNKIGDKNIDSLWDGGEVEAMPEVREWVAVLDRDLPKLDRLRSADKQRFVNALVATVMHDDQARAVELELLRVICTLIHVPLPMLTA